MKKSSFSNLKVLTVSAMLTAVSIVIGILCKNYLNFGNGLFRITFENFPILMSGILFGPVVGACVGIAADVISYILSTQSFAISPIVTLGAAAIGAVSGVVSHLLRSRSTEKQIVFSGMIAHFIGSVCIKSAGLYLYYGAAVLVRVPLYTVIAAFEILLLLFLFRRKSFSSLIQK